MSSLSAGVPPATPSVLVAKRGLSPLLGAVDFKGWHYILFFDGLNVAFPRCCACCRGPGSAWSEEWQERGKVVRYPLCAPCRVHSRITDGAALWASLIAFFVALSCYHRFYGFKVPTGMGLAALFFLIVFLATAGVVYAVLRLLALKKAGCADREWPVIMLPEDHSRALEQGKNETQTEHTFRRMRLQIGGTTAKVVTLQLSNLAVVRDIMTAHAFPASQMAVLSQKGGRPVVKTTRTRVRIDGREFESLEAAQAHLIERYGPVEGARIYAKVVATQTATMGR